MLLHLLSRLCSIQQAPALPPSSCSGFCFFCPSVSLIFPSPTLLPHTSNPSISGPRSTLCAPRLFLFFSLSPISSACHSGRGGVGEVGGQPCLPDAGPSGAYCRGCHDNDDHASAAGPVAVPI